MRRRARASGADRGAPERRLPSLDEMASRLAATLARSTADETELAWIETRTAGVSRGVEPDAGPRGSGTVLVRAREGHRRGVYRTAPAEPAELAAAVRQAVAASRVAGPIPPAPLLEELGELEEPEEPQHLAAPAGPSPPPRPWDPETAELDAPAARRFLAAVPGPVRAAHLEWTLLRVAVATSEGVERSAQATSATLHLACGGPEHLPAGGPTAGRASASDRALSGISFETLTERALARAVDRVAEDAPPAGPVLFSPEVAASLVQLLAETALSTRSFEGGDGPLAGMLGEHVLSPDVDLVDDGLDPAGLPFPFDLLGRRKRRLVVVAGGVPRTPAVDEGLSARLRLPVTPNAVGLEEAWPTHLFLEPRHREEEVMAAAEGGVWIGTLERLECFDPWRVAARARIRDARRIRHCRLAEALPELTWEDSLLRLFSRVRAVGGEPVCLAERTLLGGTVAPMLAVDGAEVLRAATGPTGARTEEP